MNEAPVMMYALLASVLLAIFTFIAASNHRCRRHSEAAIDVLAASLWIEQTDDTRAWR